MRAYRNFCKNNKNRAQAILLITDGVPDDQKETMQIARTAQESGISIATIGVQGADQNYLRRLSKDENLSFMVNDMEKLSDTFGQAVQNLLRKGS